MKSLGFGWLVCACCFFVSLISPPLGFAQYKEIDQIGDEFAKECMKARPETKIIAFADLHATDGANTEQGHYFSLILSSAMNLHMKKKYAIAEHGGFDTALHETGISRQSLTTPKSISEIAGRIKVDAVVIGDFRRDQTYYSVHLSIVRVSDGSILYSSDSKFSRNEFLDSLVEPFPPPEYKDALKYKTAEELAHAHGPTCESCPVPGYTKIAKDVRLQGTVLFEAIIAKNGELVALRPIRILGLGLDEAAYNAMMRSWKMRPARDKDGSPVAVRVPVEFTFALY
jgi:Gram-negative bacterial TonB protein C-terminal